MLENKGRITEKFSTKNEGIIIVHNNEKYRLIIKSQTIINLKEYNIGDIISFSGKKFNGKYSEEYNEIVVEKIKVLKKCLLNNSGCAISKSTSFKGIKEKQFFHTKMIKDINSIIRIEQAATIYNVLRKTLTNHSFVECKTPILTDAYQGGSALAFKTYVNYKHRESYLRTNSLRPLMIYICGGMDRVYEIGDYFRNGSTGKMHSVPYTALEIYATNINYEEMIEFAKVILANIFKNLDMFDCISDINEIEYVGFSEYIKKMDFEKFEIKNLKDYFIYKELEYNDNNNYHNINVLYKTFKEEILKKDQKLKIIHSLPAGISPFVDRKSDSEAFLKRAFIVFKGYTIIEITYCSNDFDIITTEIKKQQEYLEKNVEKAIDSKENTGYMHALKMGILPTSTLTMSIERFISLICDDEDINEYKIVI